MIMKDFYEMHEKKIRKMRKSRREIELINGDYINFIHDMKYADGIRADVAIGSHAGDLTIASSYKKRIWDFKDLQNYIKCI